MAFWTNIIFYAADFNSFDAETLTNWQHEGQIIQNSLNKEFQNAKLRFKGVRIYSISFSSSESYKNANPFSPLNDSVWVFYPYVSIEDKGDKGSKLYILEKIKYAYQGLARSKGISSDYFEKFFVGIE